MRGSVSLGDGIEMETGVGTVVADADRPRDLAVCSHAHGDHLPDRTDRPVVCSPLTARLAGVRRGDPLSRRTHPDVELVPAGHVAGSRATLVDDGDTRYLYTGDVCTRDRFYLEGFDPPSADVLVVEATYGDPDYVFPPHREVRRSALEWIDGHPDRPVVLFGYALGRAQKLQRLLADSDRSRVFVSEAIADIDGVVGDALDLTFDAREYGDDVTLGPGDALVMPSQVSSMDFVDRIADRTGALLAGFSGWAVEESFRYRGGYDETFPLSDHCDFEELVDLVRAVDPDATYTQHGFADELAGQLERRGYRARSLKAGQSTLGDF